MQNYLYAENCQFSFRQFCSIALIKSGLGWNCLADFHCAATAHSLS